MAPAAIAVPKVLTDPGYLFCAPLGSAEPTHTAAANKFTDAWPAAWLPFGATAEGSTFSYSSTVEPVRVAEFFDPIKFFTTERAGSIAFSLASFTLANYKRALNGGVAALVPTSGTGATAVNEFEPPDPGNEVRIMVGWESLDNSMRLILRQTIQGGEIASAFQKAPSLSVIPCTFQMEFPNGGGKPFKMVSAGDRG